MSLLPTWSIESPASAQTHPDKPRQRLIYIYCPDLWEHRPAGTLKHMIQSCFSWLIQLLVRKGCLLQSGEGVREKPLFPPPLQLLEPSWSSPPRAGGGIYILGPPLSHWVLCLTCSVKSTTFELHLDDLHGTTSQGCGLTAVLQDKGMCHSPMASLGTTGTPGAPWAWENQQTNPSSRGINGALEREGGETLCAEFIIAVFPIHGITTN